MSLNQTKYIWVEYRRIKSTAFNLSLPDRESVYLHSVYKKTWNLPAAQQKVDVCMCKWAVFIYICLFLCVCVCACVSVSVCVCPQSLWEATVLQLSSLFSNCIGNSFRCDQPCFEPRLLLSRSSFPSPGQQRRKRERESMSKRGSSPDLWR